MGRLDVRAIRALAGNQAIPLDEVVEQLLSARLTPDDFVAAMKASASDLEAFQKTGDFSLDDLGNMFGKSSRQIRRYLDGDTIPQGESYIVLGISPERRATILSALKKHLEQQNSVTAPQAGVSGMAITLRALRQKKSQVEELLTAAGSANKEGGIDLLFILNPQGSIEMADKAAYPHGDPGKRVDQKYQALLTSQSILNAIQNGHAITAGMRARPQDLTDFGALVGLVFSLQHAVINCRFYGDQSLDFVLIALCQDWRDFRFVKMRERLDGLIETLENGP